MEVLHTVYHSAALSLFTQHNMVWLKTKGDDDEYMLRRAYSKFSPESDRLA